MIKSCDYYKAYQDVGLRKTKSVGSIDRTHAGINYSISFNRIELTRTKQLMLNSLMLYFNSNVS